MVTKERREKIRAERNIVEVIGAKVPLKRAGSVMVGPCPFHTGGKGDSGFTVSPGLQAYHCFGCHKGGDVFRFVQDYEQVSFEEAVRLLEEDAQQKTKG